jgi:hypothetical protein
MQASWSGMHAPPLDVVVCAPELVVVVVPLVVTPLVVLELEAPCPDVEDELAWLAPPAALPWFAPPVPVWLVPPAPVSRR